MNWMPKTCKKGKYEAEYVAEKTWNADGKVWLKKERKQVIWTTEPPILTSDPKLMDDETMISPAEKTAEKIGDVRAIFDSIFTDEVCQK